jgi:hypothetical protein
MKLATVFIMDIQWFYAVAKDLIPVVAVIKTVFLHQVVTRGCIQCYWKALMMTINDLVDLFKIVGVHSGLTALNDMTSQMAHFGPTLP